jgi:hypothetical protein
VAAGVEVTIPLTSTLITIAVVILAVAAFFVAIAIWARAEEAEKTYDYARAARMAAELGTRGGGGGPMMGAVLMIGYVIGLFFVGKTIVEQAVQRSMHASLCTPVCARTCRSNPGIDE